MKLGLLPRRIRLALTIVAGALFSSCAQLDVDYVAQDFPTHAFVHEPLSIVEGAGLPPGMFSHDLAARLRQLQPSVNARPGSANGRYQMVIDLLGDHVVHDIDYSTHCGTRKVKNRSGRVVDEQEVVEDYFATSVTDRTMSVGFRIFEKASGQLVWSARGEDSRSRERQRTEGNFYPSAPPFPQPAGAIEFVSGINKVVASELEAILRNSGVGIIRCNTGIQ